MTNTTTAAESLQASAFYRWEVAEKAISIYFNLDLMDRLEREVLASFKAVTKRGSEIGGVMVGRVVPGAEKTISIEQFEPVECDYSRGPLYMLSDEDKVRLKQAVERVKSLGNGLTVAGYFRSNTRRELVLDEEDIDIAKELFSDPNHVFLLVRPFAMKPSLGGFFFWENGDIRAEGSYLEFPFKRAELLKSFAQFIGTGPGVPGAAPAAPAAKREERPQAAAPEPVPPKRDEKPSVVPPPPPLRREEPKAPAVATPPQREEAPAPPLSAAKREDAKPVVPPQREEAPPVSLKREEKPAVPPVTARREEPAPPKKEERPAPPGAVKREEPPKRDERPAPPLAFKREERPVITPVPPKQDRPSGPVLVPKREEPPAAKKEDKPAVTPIPVKPAITLKREEKAAAAPAIPKREEPAPAKEEKPAVQSAAKKEEAVVVAPPPAPVKKEEPAPAPAKIEPAPAPIRVAEPDFLEPEQPSLFARLKWVIILLAVLIVAGGAYMVFRPKPAGNEAKEADSSLALKVERNAGQILLSWNRTAPIIATATRAVLSITDGDHKEDVDLDVAQLRTGQIVYSPITNDVSFRLEVTDLKNGKSKAESVRVLAGRPSPSVANPQQPAPAQAKPAPGVQDVKPAPAAPTTPAQPAPSPAQSDPPKVTAGPAVTAAVPKPDSLAARLRAPEDLPAPPALETSANPLTARAPVGGSTTTPAAPAPPPVQTQQQAPAPAPVTQAAKPVQPPAAQPAPPARQGGQAQEARVLRRPQPSYPPLARQTRVSGIVRVQAIIGKDGKVKRANAVSGPPLLRLAAVEAVLRWQYSPATLNGEAVETETTVDINFAPVR